MNQLSYEELQQWQKEHKDFVLIDVREPFENEQYNIGGLNIPMGELLASIKQFPLEKKIVLYCEKGIRSVIAIQRLEAIGFKELYNLSGGVYPLRLGKPVCNNQ